MKNDQNIRFEIFKEEIFTLKQNTLLLEKFTSFPWETLRLEVLYRMFNETTVTALFEYSFVIIYRLYYDKTQRTITLPKFVKSIFEIDSNELNSAEIEEVKKNLLLIEMNLEEYKEKVSKIRHNKLGHLNEFNATYSRSKYGLFLNDLNSIINNLENYVKCVSLIYFATNIEFDEDNYYEHVFNQIALSSELLTLKENNPVFWEAQERVWSKNGLRESDLSILNYYRQNLLNLEKID